LIIDDIKIKIGLYYHRTKQTKESELFFDHFFKINTHDVSDWLFEIGKEY